MLSRAFSRGTAFARRSMSTYNFGRLDGRVVVVCGSVRLRDRKEALLVPSTLVAGQPPSGGTWDRRDHRGLTTHGLRLNVAAGRRDDERRLRAARCHRVLGQQRGDLLSDSPHGGLTIAKRALQGGCKCAAQVTDVITGAGNKGFAHTADCTAPPSFADS